MRWILSALRWTGFTLAGVAALVAAAWVANATVWSGYSAPTTVLAHRGLGQTFPLDGVGNDDCTATLIRPPEHDHLENTLAGTRAAFAAGADIVEFDVHPTTDGDFAVFHDWTLDCRTDGTGVTRTHAMTDLKRLDIGYGYTADGGATFPFRGRFVGAMPTLRGMLDAFPDRRFLFNVKSDDPEEGEKLAAALSRLPADRLALLSAYGGDRPMAALAGALPGMKIMGRKRMFACLREYELTGWTGYMPEPCRNTILLIPHNVGGVLWGWPRRFVERMDKVGTDVYVLGAYRGGDPGSRGVDSLGELTRIPDGFPGGVWTNRADLIAPAVKGARAP